jgi:hypothetical protein
LFSYGLLILELLLRTVVRSETADPSSSYARDHRDERGKEWRPPALGLRRRRKLRMF